MGHREDWKISIGVAVVVALLLALYYDSADKLAFRLPIKLLYFIIVGFAGCGIVILYSIMKSKN